MSRVVNTNSPGKQRNQLMRTAAELLRRLSQKAELDEEAKDMAALLVFCLKEISDGIDSSAAVWEKRDYWIKAERLRQRWSWSGSAAARLEGVILNEAWEAIPGMMGGLLEYFADIKIVKFTRPPSVWQGAYQRLVDEME
ncbi:MAG: hypothetical protein JXJ20_05135 [Anaerolineae bacterium]|nr:hypothetical protein [Anaerolineae bacterium]